MTIGIVWLQDDAPGVNEGVWQNNRLGTAMWSPRVNLYDYTAHPPIGVIPSAHELTNVSAGANLSVSQATKLGLIIGIQTLAVPHQDYTVAFDESGGAPATIVDSVNNACVDFLYQSGAITQGSFVRGSDTWKMLQLPAAFQSDGNDHIRLYKNGAGQDVTHEIIVQSNSYVGCFYDGASDKVYFAYNDLTLGNQSLWLVEFTLSTGVWGVPHANVVGFGVGTAGGQPYTMVFSISTGIWHLIYTNLLGHPVYAFYNGTTWTFPVITVPNGGVSTWLGQSSYMLLDPNGTTVHLVMGNRYSQIQAGGVLASTFNLDSMTIQTIFGGRGVIDGGSIFIPYTDNNTGQLYCFVGTPLNAPSWTLEFVDDAFSSLGGVAEEQIGVFLPVLPVSGGNMILPVRTIVTLPNPNDCCRKIRCMKSDRYVYSERCK